jgi:hypothetical protein
MGMIFRADTDKRSAHDQLVEQVAGLLKSQRWSVEEQPILAGNRRPDIIAESPEGTAYVFEVKTGSSEAHLGAVAQVESYRNSLSAERGLDANGVLIMLGDVPPQLSAVAKNADVELVEAHDMATGGPDSLEAHLAALA